MIGPITNNSLLSSAFGPGALRDLYRPSGQRADRSDDGRSGDGASGHSQPVDTVELSGAALRRVDYDTALPGRSNSSTVATGGAAPETTGSRSTTDSQITVAAKTANAKAAAAKAAAAKTAPETGARSAGTEKPGSAEQAEVRKLKDRDAEVRRHEQAHQSAAGQYASGGASFEYETGPDGRRYAVSGEVQIDTSAVQGDPQATITKMQQIRRAALAPGSPSSQDRAVASQASKAEQQARAELAEQRRETQETQSGGSTTSTEPGASQDTSQNTTQVMAQVREGFNQPSDAPTNQSIAFGAGNPNGSAQTRASIVQAVALASHNTRAAMSEATRRGLLDLIA